MPESRLSEVAQELLRQSGKHKVDWEDTGRRASYRVVSPDVVLAISRVQPVLEEDSELRLELMNETGRVIDSVETSHEDPMHLILSQIFELAEQHVRDIGINQALDYLKSR
jgi:hypothetical protein